jgi:hypothetical protein
MRPAHRSSVAPVPLLDAGDNLTARILSASELKAEGIHGFAVELSRMGSDQTASPLAVQIPQKLLAGLYGADYSSRVRWVQTIEPSAADFAPTGRSTASLAPTPIAETTDAATNSVVLTPTVSSRAMLLTPMATPVSTTGTGSFAATPLNPASSWDVSAQTGDFSWSLPLRTPPAAAGPAPSVSLNYDSQSIDGETGWVCCTVR